VSVTNVLGQETAQILDEQRSQGEHTVSFSVRHLPQGMMFVRLQTRANSTIQAVQVMR